jgi:colanic acid/amylovoran biosynthesis glycosyltransferase
MKIAYLSTEYPHITHTFIRREIHGVERCGIEVLRISIRRPANADLPDPADREELGKTVGVLDRGAGLLLDVLVVAIARPGVWLRTAARAVAYGWRSNRGLLRHLAYFGEACVVLRILRRAGAQHVHAHFGENATMVALLVKHLGGPGYSFQVHGPGEFDAPRFIHLPEKVAAARFVTAITDYARGQILRWSPPQHWGKVHVIRCGVDEKFIKHDSVPLPDQPRFISVGRLSRSKAQPMLIEAVARLVQEGRKFEVILIGSGELREYLERSIAQRGIGHVLKLVGVKSGEDVRRELINARALLLPSFGEGLPVVIMEAFALSRPAITTQIAGIPELVVDGHNGWLIPAGNLERLVEAMRQVLDAPVERLRQMGAAGRSAVLEKHDAAHEAAKLARLFIAASETEVFSCASQ